MKLVSIFTSTFRPALLSFRCVLDHWRQLKFPVMSLLGQCHHPSLSPAALFHTGCRRACAPLLQDAKLGGREGEGLVSSKVWGPRAVVRGLSLGRYMGGQQGLRLKSDLACSSWLVRGVHLLYSCPRATCNTFLVPFWISTTAWCQQSQLCVLCLVASLTREELLPSALQAEGEADANLPWSALRFF